MAHNYKPFGSAGGFFGLLNRREGDPCHLLVGASPGRAMGAGLGANRLYTEIVAELRRGTQLGELLRQLNRFVMQSIGGSLVYFTIAAARLYRGGRRMTFAAGGHPPAMIVTPGEEPRLLESRSTLLGALPDPVPSDPALDVGLEFLGHVMRRKCVAFLISDFLAPVASYERALRIWRTMYGYALDVHYPAGGDWLFVHYEPLIAGTAADPAGGGRPGL